MMTKEEKSRVSTQDENSQLLPLLKEYVQLEAVDKLTVSITVAIALAVLFVFLFTGIFCLGISLSTVVADAIGSKAGGYALTGLLFALLGVGFWMVRKALLDDFIMRIVARIVTRVTTKAEKEIAGEETTTIANN